MLNPGYYVVLRNLVLRIDSKRIRLSKHDWLVTDGANLGVFDPVFALDWVPLKAGERMIVLTDELSTQIAEAAVQVTFSKLQQRFQRSLDTGDGAPIPDMPKPSLAALGPYLRAHRTLVAYSYGKS
jgi:hypothetical protein